MITFGDSTFRHKPAWLSGADLSAKVGYFAVASTGTWVLGGDNTGTHIILDGGAASGDYVEVAFGHVMCLAGGTVAAGDYIVCNASGLAVTSSTGKNPVGRAISGGGSGEWIEAFIYLPVDEATA